MKKQKISDQEFDELVFEAGKFSNDNINFEARMAELEEILRSFPHLRLSARMVIQRGRLLTNNGNVKDAIAIYDQGAEMAIKEQNIAMQALALRMKGTNQIESEDLDGAEQSLKRAITLSEATDNKYQKAACLNSLSILYVKQSDFEKYLETSEEALSVLKSAGVDDLTYARSYINTMVARTVELLNIKVHDRALEMLEELLASPEFELAGEFGHLSAMLTKGQYLTETGQYKESNEVLFGLLKDIADKPVNEEIAAIHSYLAENMLALKKYKEAEYHIKIAEQYHRKTNQIFFLCENLLCHSLLLTSLKKHEDAMAYRTEAETLAASGSDFQIWQFNEKYAEFFAKQKNYHRAYECLQTAKKHQSKSLRTDYDKRISSILNRYELMEKEKQYQLLKKDLEMKKQELTMASDFLNQKVELLKEMKGFMKNMRKENLQKNEIMKALDRKIDSVINVEYEQQQFIDKIEISGNDFIQQIRKKYPKLSLTEAKVCSLVRNNFSNKEIANLLVTSLRTIENHRYNIRKKLGIKGDDSFMQVLNNI